MTENADRGFHVHVYWRTPAERQKAVALREQFEAELPSAQISRMYEEAVVFHPAALYEVTVASNDLGRAYQLVVAHRDGLPVMVHPLTTTDPIRAHTADAVWFGDVLPLDIELLERMVAGEKPPGVGPG